MTRMFSQAFLNALRAEVRQEFQREVRRAGGQSVGSQLSGMARQRYASGSGIRSGSFIDGLISRFLGRNHTILDELRKALGGGISTRDIARELMRGADMLDEPQARTGGAGRGRGGGRTGLPPDEPDPPDSPLQPVGRSRKDAPPRPGEESPFGQETITPQSSNVFSFSYQPKTSTLYVTFKANKLNPDSVRKGRGRRGGMEQLRGALGSTVSGKTNERGPMYAYLRVKAEVYQRMQIAQSKGRFVWDELRRRGTIDGHRYRYHLVQGQVVTQAGVSGTYIPRKATSEGFRVRSVASIGEGRRRFESSTLPSQNGFRTRRVSRR